MDRARRHGRMLLCTSELPTASTHHTLTDSSDGSLTSTDSDRSQSPWANRLYSPATTVSSVSSRGSRSSCFSGHTACTTPIRPSFPGPEPNKNWFSALAYLKMVADADLPDPSLHFFYNVGADIANLASVLQPSRSSNGPRADPRTIAELCRGLFTQIHTTSMEIFQQARQVRQLKSLEAFHTRPENSDVWSTYLQRARLIIQNTSLPSKAEYDLTKSAAELFRNQIYEPYFRGRLGVSNPAKLKSSMDRVLTQLFDAFLRLRITYRTWCREMKDLRNNYMLPLLTRIHMCPEVLGSIQSFRKAKQLVEQVAVPTQTPGAVLADERLMKALNLSARRRADKFKRAKVRYKREHTL